MTFSFFLINIFFSIFSIHNIHSATSCTWGFSFSICCLYIIFHFFFQLFSFLATKSFLPFWHHTLHMQQIIWYTLNICIFIWYSTFVHFTSVTAITFLLVLFLHDQKTSSKWFGYNVFLFIFPGKSMSSSNHHHNVILWDTFDCHQVCHGRLNNGYQLSKSVRTVPRRNLIQSSWICIISYI